MTTHYRKCPQCLEKTRPSPVMPIASLEAHGRAKHAAFGWHLINSLLQST